MTPADDRIPDTPLFDRKRSLRGYRINKMAMGLSQPANREAFKQDESAYLDRFGLDPEEKAAVMSRNWREMVRLGGNLFFILKISAVDPCAHHRDRGASSRDGSRRLLARPLREEIAMAKLIGGLGTSHVPSIGAAIDKGLRDTPDWKPFFDGYIPGQRWVEEMKPDVAVVIFNDHGNSFFSTRCLPLRWAARRSTGRWTKAGAPARSRPSKARSISPGTSSTASSRTASTR
jgi:protocatechuate 4,5-dioxygenase alpha chain